MEPNQYYFILVNITLPGQKVPVENVLANFCTERAAKEWYEHILANYRKVYSEAELNVVLMRADKVSGVMSFKKRGVE